MGQPSHRAISACKRMRLVTAAKQPLRQERRTQGQWNSARPARQPDRAARLDTETTPPRAPDRRRRPPRRLRSEAAFAHQCTVAPSRQSSGKRTRLRLYRGGHRQAYYALWRITRMSSHPPSRAYVARRTAEGLCGGRAALRT